MIDLRYARVTVLVTATPTLTLLGSLKFAFLIKFSVAYFTVDRVYLCETHFIAQLSYILCSAVQIFVFFINMRMMRHTVSLLSVSRYAFLYLTVQGGSKSPPDKMQLLDNYERFLYLWRKLK